LFLGPAFPATCVQCGRKIGVPYLQSLVASLPFIVATFVAALVPSVYLEVAVWIVGAVVMFLLFMFWVPLIKR